VNRLEAKIRDYLAGHLDLLAPNLRLIRPEYPLENPFGAGGAIDIRAQDTSFGHYVVIEIKRSDQVARAALHELTKYVALLKATLGIRPENIRALLLSTEWHELAVPFAEYMQVREVPTEGLVITAQPDGHVTDVTPFVPPILDQPLTICRQQHVFLFSDPVRRDSEIPNLVAAAKQAELLDFAVLSADYSGGNRAVIHPHGAYLIFSSPLKGANSTNADRIKAAIDWDDELDDLDENFLVAVMDRIQFDYDSSEIGYPEKLAQIMSSDWVITVSAREGRYGTNSTILTDDQLIKEAAKTEGGANHYLIKTVSPRYVQNWEQFRVDARLVLLGDGDWSTLFEEILDGVELRHPNATVSVHIYNLANITFSLVKLFGRQDPTYMPAFQVIVTSGDEVVTYIGVHGWNGHVTKLQGQEWTKMCFGSLDGYMLAQHFGEQFENDDKARTLLGLSSLVIEVRRQGTNNIAESELRIVKGTTVSRPLASSQFLSIAEFWEANSAFGDSLENMAKSVAFGWV